MSEETEKQKQTQPKALYFFGTKKDGSRRFSPEDEAVIRKLLDAGLIEWEEVVGPE